MVYNDAPSTDSQPCCVPALSRLLPGRPPPLFMHLRLSHRPRPVQSANPLPPCRRHPPCLLASNRIALYLLFGRVNFSLHDGRTFIVNQSVFAQQWIIYLLLVLSLFQNRSSVLLPRLRISVQYPSLHEALHHLRLNPRCLCHLFLKFLSAPSLRRTNRPPIPPTPFWAPPSIFRTLSPSHP